MASLKVLSQNLSESTEKNQRKPQDSRYPSRDSNIGLQEYTSDALRLNQFPLVFILV
jgi:hypothetical protein